ncbi:MAG: PilZ domain-containing protein [Candidatus Omnitrophica bacterium]|nr:PilZ domain-containing protein [Candidatus Omnitrophota bacterium]
MQDITLKLIQDNWIDTQQFNLASQESERTGKSIWASLIKLGFLSSEDVAIFFAQETGIPYVRVSDYSISSEVLNLVEEGFCRENLFIPLFKVKEKLYIAMINPLDTALVDRITKITGLDIEPLISNIESINSALDTYYGLSEEAFAIEKFVFKQQPLRKIGYWREQERLPLKIPVYLQLDDKEIKLHYSSPIEGTTCNISHGGTAVGLNIFLFIPKGVKVNLEFKPKHDLNSSSPLNIKAKGEIIYCRMEKEQRYFLGIKFIQIDDESRNKLITLAGKYGQK